MHLHLLLEHQLIEAYGSLDVVPSAVRPLLGLVGAAYDEADQRSSQENGARFNAFMDNTPMIVALKDANGIIVYANKTCERNFPHISTLGGLMSFSWLPPEIAGTSEEDAEVLAAGRVLESLQAVPMPGNALRHWLVYRFPVPAENGTTLVGVSALDVTERRNAEDALRRQALILEMIHDAVIVTDLRASIISCNEATQTLFGYSADELRGHTPSFWRRGSERDPSVDDIFKSVLSEGRWAGDIRFVRKDGTEGLVEAMVVPLLDEAKQTVGFIAVNRDITERRAMSQQLLQSQKLEAIGQLAAGIAHEINTPTQYVADNVNFLEGAFGDLSGLLTCYRELLDAARGQESLAELVGKVDEAAKAADVDYLTTEVPSAIHQSMDGLRRIAEIVRGVRAFAHPGGGSKTGVDLNAAVKNVITVARNEWKYVADLETTFDAELPMVPCFAGEINQVFLNILVNAAHAIDEVIDQESGARGRIHVSTHRDGDWVEVRIGDNGPGIPAEYQSRVFDPFFTTKPVGKGTGQGLAISHRVVVENHGGTLSFETAPDKGTTFIVRLPLDASANHSGVFEERAA